MGAWEDGFAAGWASALAMIAEGRGAVPSGPSHTRTAAKLRRAKPKKTTKRRASPAQKRYGREFKRLAPKYKKKSGGWKKDGFKRCAAAARKAAKK